MNLSQAIHQRWAAATALEELLPASRVFTGASFDPAPPFAAITKESDRPDSYQSDGSAIDLVVLRIRVFHVRCDVAEQIVHEIKSAFDRATFDLSGADKVLNMQRLNDYQRQRDDGVWEMIIDFKCTVYLASGV